MHYREMHSDRRLRCLAFFFYATLLRAVAFAEWPQFRGPYTDGSADGEILPTWSELSPRILWKRPVESGFSSLVIATDRLATLELRELNGVTVEVCIALDAATGSELWTAPLAPAKYTGIGYDSGNYGAPGNQGGDGPRSTPAIDKERVYAASSRLVLHCLDANSGAELWKRDLVAEFGGSQISYENAASPLLFENSVIVAGGGEGESILAFEKTTGNVLWKAHNELLTHSTPLLTTLHGQRQAIFFTKAGLFALDPASGEGLWRYKFPFRVCAAITPVVAGNRVYCSAGYGIGSGVCEVSRGKDFRAAELWRKRHNEPVASYWSTPVYRDGHLYGIFGFKKFHTAPLKCVEVETGNVKWEEPGFGHGNVILVGSMLIAQTGYGDLVLIRPKSSEYRELGRITALTGKCWSTPAYSDGKLFVRSTKEAACIVLPTAETTQLTDAKNTRLDPVN